VGCSPDEVDFFNLPNPSTEPRTEMSTRNVPGG
jgi:hypothetical protein